MTICSIKIQLNLWRTSIDKISQKKLYSIRNPVLFIYLGALSLIQFVGLSTHYKIYTQCVR